MNEDWSETEVALIVNDYFDMLQEELEHRKYNKTEHRNELVSKLGKNRTGGAVEFKHQNISAALLMGLPFIKGTSRCIRIKGF